MTRAFFKFLLSTWFFRIYFFLGALYLILSPLIVSDATVRAALFQTMGLMTGSDPYSFKGIESHGLLWILAWLIHIASWLLIPALIAIVIGDAKEDIKNEQELEKALRLMLDEAGGNPDDAKELRALIDQAMKTTMKEKDHESTRS